MTHAPILNYQNPPPRLSKLAVGTFVASIVVALGFFLIVPSLIVWLIAFGVSGELNKRIDLTGHGLARAAVHVSGWSFLAGCLAFMLMPSVGSTRTFSNRSVCAANLRGTAQSMNVYASDFGDAYPIISPLGGYSLATTPAGTPQTTADNTLRSIHAAAIANVPQNIWILVLTDQVSPKQFICKSDPSPLVDASATHGANYQTNFNDGTGKLSDLSYSYSFAYPWQTGADTSIGAWWKCTTDASLPLIADMAPLNGTGTPAAAPTLSKRREANSFNHQRDGQNVGYGDAHAEFARNPAVGQSNDNIYTFNAGIPTAAGTPHAGIAPLVGTGGTPGNYDICLVPAADGATYERH